MKEIESLTRDQLKDKLYVVHNLIDKIQTKKIELLKLEDDLSDLEKPHFIEEESFDPFLVAIVSIPLFMILYGLCVGVMELPEIYYAWFNPMKASYGREYGSVPGNTLIIFLAPTLIILVGLVLYNFTSKIIKFLVCRSRLINLFLFVIFCIIFYYINEVVITHAGNKLSTFRNILLIVAAICSYIYEIRIVQPYRDELNESVKRKNEIIQEECDKENQLISEKNEIIRNKQHDIYNEINKLDKELNEYIEGWYPKDYLSLYDCKCFISILENYEADNLKEMIAVHKTNEYRKAEVKRQEEALENQKRANKKIISQQESMLNNQRAANIINSMNMVANYNNANNTANISKSLDDILNK